MPFPINVKFPGRFIELVYEFLHQNLTASIHTVND